MTALATQVSDFAALLTPAPGNPGRLNAWIARTRAANLRFLHSFATGLERDRTAVNAALTLPWHNGRTEGVNHKIKLLKRQTYGRALPGARVGLVVGDVGGHGINASATMGRLRGASREVVQAIMHLALRVPGPR